MTAKGAASAGYRRAVDEEAPAAGFSLLTTRWHPGVGWVTMDPKGLVLTSAPASALDSFITPAAQHAVVAHHGVARCQDQRWSLMVDGLVRRPLCLDLEKLRAYPAREVTAVLECAGDPERPDRPTRLVSNAVWRGAPLPSLLEEAGGVRSCQPALGAVHDQSVHHQRGRNPSAGLAAGGQLLVDLAGGRVRSRPGPPGAARVGLGPRRRRRGARQRRSADGRGRRRSSRPSGGGGPGSGFEPSGTRRELELPMSSWLAPSTGRAPASPMICTSTRFSGSR